MDNIIEGLLRIEEEAVHVTRQAEKELEKLPQDIAAETQKIASRIAAGTQRQIEAMHVASHLSCAKKIETIGRQGEAKAVSMTKLFEKNSANWEWELFQKITEW